MKNLIKIEKLEREKKTFGLKLFFSYITFTLLLIGSITIIHIYFSEELKLKKFEREVTLQSAEKKKEFTSFLKKSSDAVLAIEKNDYFIKYVDDGSFNYYIDLLFLTIMEANKEYMQVRFIDNTGMEKLRFEREKKSQEPFKTLSLQDKSSRYYFQNASKIKKGDVWFSPVDLNVEHGKIEIPNRGVFRVATPVYVNKKFKGILVINIFVKELFDSLTNSSIYDIYIVSENNYYIRHKDKQHNWSYYNSKHTINKDFDTKILNKLNTDSIDSRVLTSNMFIQHLKVGQQNLKMIFVEKDKSLKEIQENNNKMIIAILIFSFFMSIIFSIIFSNPIKRMHEVVVLQAEKLVELAKTLDKKVQIETLKNAKKDRLLQNQNKFAELGDMIGNIAHQWRHPLTRLSLTLQNLKAFQKKDKLTNEVLNNSLENSLEQIEFMSNTIDNFKDFYKKNNEKNEFSVKIAFESILNIIGHALEHKNIKINLTDYENVKIYANKNEFSQVLMNLIVNAKDAFDENLIDKPQIDIKIIKDNKNTKITIHDNAGGIKEDIISNIFDPYFTTKKDKGTGIGLYLSKAIIEDKMKGKIYVENKDRGSLFTIIL